MARLPYLEKSQVAPEHQDLMDRDISPSSVISRAPRMTSRLSASSAAGRPSVSAISASMSASVTPKV